MATEYNVFVAFDLKDAEPRDYDRVYDELEPYGFAKTYLGNGLPSTTLFKTTTEPFDNIFPSTSLQFNNAFTACGVNGRVLINILKRERNNYCRSEFIEI